MNRPYELSLTLQSRRYQHDYQHDGNPLQSITSLDLYL